MEWTMATTTTTQAADTLRTALCKAWGAGDREERLRPVAGEEAGAWGHRVAAALRGPHDGPGYEAARAACDAAEAAALDGAGVEAVAALLSVPALEA
jgi:hypothetical protein